LPLARVASAALTIAGVALSPTAVAEERIIVDTAFVEDAITDGGALVWDVRGQKDYLRGHIPGAVTPPKCCATVAPRTTSRSTRLRACWGKPV
jgi:3-mercaptopyruvate sulfurtransferase SseA